MRGTVRRPALRRALTVAAVGAIAGGTLGAPPTARAAEPAGASFPVELSLDRGPGDWEWDGRFVFGEGDVATSELAAVPAEARVWSGVFGVGYDVGELGPLPDLAVRLEGAGFVAGAESLARSPVGAYVVHRDDRAGFLRARVAAQLARTPADTLGVSLAFTAPLDLELDKLATERLHYASAALELSLSPASFVAVLGRVELGSGVYRGEKQQNPQLAGSTLLAFEAPRWLLPWRAGIAFGPAFSGDLSAHTDRRWAEVFGEAEAEVSALEVALAVYPYLRLGDYAALEFGYVRLLAGSDAAIPGSFSIGARGKY